MRTNGIFPQRENQGQRAQGPPTWEWWGFLRKVRGNSWAPGCLLGPAGRAPRSSLLPRGLLWRFRWTRRKQEILGCSNEVVCKSQDEKSPPAAKQNRMKAAKGAAQESPRVRERWRPAQHGVGGVATPGHLPVWARSCSAAGSGSKDAAAAGKGAGEAQGQVVRPGQRGRRQWETWAAEGPPVGNPNLPAGSGAVAGEPRHRAFKGALTFLGIPPANGLRPGRKRGRGGLAGVSGSLSPPPAAR